MKLSERSPGGEIFFLRAPLYSILAVYIPLSFLVSLTLICGVILSALEVPVSLSYGLLLVPAFLSALAASFYHYFMRQAKSGHIGADMRGGILVLALTYPAASLGRFGVPLGLRFLPGLPNSAAALFSLYTWISVISLKRMFGAREIFESYTKQYSGEKLREAVLEDAAVLRAGDSSMLKPKVTYLMQLALMVLLIAVCGVLQIRLPLVIYALSIILVINGVFIFTWINLLKAEEYYAGEGLALSEADHLGRIPGMLFFILAGAGAAILLASERSILPFSWITGFFAWLLSLFPRPAPAADTGTAVPVMPDIMGPAGMVPPFLESKEPSAPWPVWEWLQYAAIGLLIGGFIWFMIKPLFAKGRFSGARLSFAERLWSLAAQWFQSLRTLIVNCMALFKRSNSSPGLREAEKAQIRRLSSELLKKYGPAKRREMRDSVNLFARLIIWGSERRHVLWKPSHAPGEYCRRLAAAGDLRTGEAVIRCGEIFEEALYSPAVLPEKERKEFKELVQEITDTAE
jgi:hypothetical protein